MKKALNNIGSILVAGAFGSLCFYTDTAADLIIFGVALVAFIAGFALIEKSKELTPEQVEILMEAEKADRLYTAQDYSLNKYGN